MAIQIATKEQQLANLERDMERNQKALGDYCQKMGPNWFEFCKALWKIREGKLYEPEYRTFPQYSLQRWKIKRSRALRLCRTYEILKNSKMSIIVDNLLENSGISEVAALQLTDVALEQREEVVKEVSKNGKPTAKSIKAAAAKRLKVIEIIEKDREGYPIPGPAMAVWDRRDEVNDRLRFLSEFRQWAEDMQGTDDPFYAAEIIFSSLKLQIEAVISTLKGAVPHAVCPACQGQAPLTCEFCKGKGMVSKFRYHSAAVPDEMKEMRKSLAHSV